jgi:hypothetical protein
MINTISTYYFITLLSSTFSVHKMSFVCLALGIIAVYSSAVLPDISSLFAYGINDDNNENETSVSSDSGVDDNPNDKPDFETEKKDVPCNAFAILGPTYVGPSGCPLPCPSGDSQQIPQGCPKNNHESDKSLDNKGIVQVPDRQTDNDGSKNPKSDRSSLAPCYAIAGPTAEQFCAKPSEDKPVQEQKNYDSGYSHGCADAKISDPSQRYINQPGMGPNFHTDNFDQEYKDGFSICLKSQDTNNCQNGICTVTPVYPDLESESNSR